MTTETIIHNVKTIEKSCSLIEMGDKSDNFYCTTITTKSDSGVDTISIYYKVGDYPLEVNPATGMALLYRLIDSNDRSYAKGYTYYSVAKNMLELEAKLNRPLFVNVIEVAIETVSERLL